MGVEGWGWRGWGRGVEIGSRGGGAGWRQQGEGQLFVQDEVVQQGKIQGFEAGFWHWKESVGCVVFLRCYCCAV